MYLSKPAGLPSGSEFFTDGRAADFVKCGIFLAEFDFGVYADRRYFERVVAMAVKKELLRLDEMEPIAREATRWALSEYAKPPVAEQGAWTLGSFDTEVEGLFEIYIPSGQPLDAKVISRARVNRHTGEASVEVFLEKS
jgi:hypothetical protein